MAVEQQKTSHNDVEETNKKKRKSKRKHNKKVSAKKVCYTGIGSKKNGNYTSKSFLDLMEKEFDKECSRFMQSKKCKPCKKMKAMTKKYLKKIKSRKTTNKDLDKYEKQLDKTILKCEKCKNKSTIKCLLQNYMEYSGAKYGKC